MRRLPLFSFVLIMFSFSAGCQHDVSGGGGTSGVTVTMSPQTATVSTFGTATFTPSVSGTTNTALTWQVNSVTGGGTVTGTISTAGVYSAPHYISGTIIPSNGNPVTVTITAISQADASATATATVTLVPQNQNAQTGAIELGTSGGNANASSQQGQFIDCCGGTLGSLVVRNGTNFILSNNHVLANSDAGNIGDAIIQPGLIDSPAQNCTTSGTTTVANLSQFFTLENNPPDPVDVAIAQIGSGKVDTSGNILLLGATADANGVPVPGAPHAGSGVAASIGMAVAKSGRTSGLTCSTIDSVSDAFSVDYYKICGGSVSYTVNYTNQITVSGADFSDAGDSGSLIVTQDTADPVALLFAGSDTDTAGNPIEDDLLAMADSNNNVPTIVGGAAHQVIGCTLPGPSNAQKTASLASVPEDAMQNAIAARNANAQQLLGLPGVHGLGVGASVDYPGQAAVLLFVAPGTPHSGLPMQIGGVRTRIVETASENATGILSEEESEPLAPAQDAFAVTALSAAELQRAKTAHTANVAYWMKQPGVQGFGITSSADALNEAALMIFLIRGATYNAIPPTIGGVRTRIRVSSRFRAGLSPNPMRPGCRVPAVRTAATAKTAGEQTRKSN
jgi:hypothetical protein